MSRLLHEFGLLIVSTWLLIAVAMPALAQPTAPKWESPGSTNPAQRLLNFSTTVELLGKPTPVTISFFCDPITTKESSGALGFDIVITDATRLKPFNFEDFEGPDALAGSRKLLQITITRPGKPALTFSSRMSGWTPEGSNFAFGVADLSRNASSTPKSILRALGDNADSMHIAITDPRNAKMKLEFSIPVADRQAAFKALLAGLK